MRNQFRLDELIFFFLKKRGQGWPGFVAVTKVARSANGGSVAWPDLASCAGTYQLF